MNGMLVALVLCQSPAASCVELATYDTRSECVMQALAVRLQEKGARLACRPRHPMGDLPAELPSGPRVAATHAPEEGGR